MLCGGTKPVEDATPEVQKICEAVKEELQGKMNCVFNEFTAHKMRTQIVAGKNYFVKVHIGDEKYVHVRIYVDLQQKIELSNFQVEKSKEDEIEYF